MTKFTPNYNLPYPEGKDRVAVHSDVRSLALKADTEIEVTRAEALERYIISHVDLDLDGQPYFAPGTGTTRVFPDVDGTPYFLPS